ncbi:hypothetical protein XELAEV_18024764mg [Xenopus laevis]|uniref:Uncharacterized protein n=1 Tax=Xenopus laevis TaxID=8355 RepID=A0A974HL86_XENLA|nr:hypothetical protein XELAEV_18024764mg [Xenopus laevis]
MRHKGHWGYSYGHCATTGWIMGLLHPPECHTLPPSRKNPKAHRIITPIWRYLSIWISRLSICAILRGYCGNFGSTQPGAIRIVAGGTGSKPTSYLSTAQTLGSTSASTSRDKCVPGSPVYGTATTAHSNSSVSALVTTTPSGV